MKLSLIIVAVLASVASASLNEDLRNKIDRKLRGSDAPSGQLSTSKQEGDVSRPSFQEEQKDEEAAEPELVFDQVLNRCRNMDNGQFVKTKLCIAFDHSVERCRDLNTGRFVKSKFCIEFAKDVSRCRDRLTGKFLSTRLCVKQERSGRCRDRLNGQFLPKEVCEMLKPSLLQVDEAPNGQFSTSNQEEHGQKWETAAETEEAIQEEEEAAEEEIEDEEEGDHLLPVLVFDEVLERCRNMDNGQFVKTNMCIQFDHSVERCRNLHTGRFVKSKYCIEFAKDVSRCRDRLTGKFLKTRLCVKQERSGRCRDRLTGKFLPGEVCEML